MWDLAPHLVWAGVVLYLGYRAEKLAEAHRREADATNGIPPLIEVPEDLVALANQEREAWAQEEVLRAVRERYEELRDWNKVRSAVGIGRIDG